MLCMVAMRSMMSLSIASWAAMRVLIFLQVLSLDPESPGWQVGVKCGGWIRVIVLVGSGMWLELLVVLVWDWLPRDTSNILDGSG